MAVYTEYLDGGLPEGVRERFEVHLARCESCARYHRVMRRGLRLVHEMPELEPSTDFQQRLQHRLFHLQDERIRPRRLRARPGAVLSIAALGLFALAVWRPLTEDEAAFEAMPVAEMLGWDAAVTSDIGGADAWFVGMPSGSMNAAVPSSISLAFPGPYSPLIVAPPLQTGAHARFTSLRLE